MLLPKQDFYTEILQTIFRY